MKIGYGDLGEASTMSLEVAYKYWDTNFMLYEGPDKGYLNPIPKFKFLPNPTPGGNQFQDPGQDFHQGLPKLHVLGKIYNLILICSCSKCMKSHFLASNQHQNPSPVSPLQDPYCLRFVKL